MHRPEMCQGMRPFTRRLMQPKSSSSHFGVKKRRKPSSQITPNNHAHRTQRPIFLASPLNVGVVGDGDNGLGGVTGLGDQVAVTGTNSLALQVDVDALLLGLTLLEGVLLDTVDELLAGAGVLDVLNADADALLEVAVVDALVEEDTDGGLGDVVDDTGLTVVNLVGHTVQSLSYCVPSKGKMCVCRLDFLVDLTLLIACNWANKGKGNIRIVLTPSGRHR